MNFFADGPNSPITFGYVDSQKILSTPNKNAFKIYLTDQIDEYKYTAGTPTSQDATIVLGILQYLETNRHVSSAHLEHVDRLRRLAKKYLYGTEDPPETKPVEEEKSGTEGGV